MSKKTFELIVTISGAVSAVAIGLVTYFSPAHATAINSSIETAVDNKQQGNPQELENPIKTRIYSEE